VKANLAIKLDIDSVMREEVTLKLHSFT